MTTLDIHAFGQPFGGIGIRLVENPYHQEYRQVRFPRSKRKRIRKKWRKDHKKNWGLRPE